MYHISATVLVPSSYAESPRGNSHLPFCSSCVSSHVPLIAHSDLFPSHAQLCGSTLPFQTLSLQQPSAISLSPALCALLLLILTTAPSSCTFSPRVRMEEIVCQQHLRQQGFLTILGSLLC